MMIKFRSKIICQIFIIKDNFIVNKQEKLVQNNNLIQTDFYHKLKIHNKIQKNNLCYSNIQKINLNCLN